MHKSIDLIKLTIFFIFSLLSFLGGRAVRQKVHQCFSSAHSPDTTANEDTKTRATPTRIGQRAEKMSTLEGVSRGEHLPLRHRVQCIYAHIRPLADRACDTTKPALHRSRNYERRWERNAPMTPHYVLCTRKTISLSRRVCVCVCVLRIDKRRSFVINTLNMLDYLTWN